VVRQGRSIAVVGVLLIGCAVFLIAGASGVQAQDSKKEEARCKGTRTFKKSDAGGGLYTTNDLPGCPKGGLLLGTDKADAERARPGLSGEDGDDEIRGLGGSDEIFHGSGDDVIYAGPGNDDVYPDTGGKDVIYGGDGNDMLASNDDGGDKLYCGAGRDKYFANPTDYVDSSCETASAPPAQSGHDVIYSASASPSSGPQVLADGGGPSILLPAAAMLVGSGILTYAIVRRR
jgi:Ca2+-binding RTX toxin-like protein